MIPFEFGILPSLATPDLKARQGDQGRIGKRFSKGEDFMRESVLRTWHRNLGIVLAVFIIFQAGSGFFISLSQMSVSHTHAHEENHPSAHGHDEGVSFWHESLRFIHHGGGTLGTIYRIIVGAGTLVMVLSGGMIFFKIRARSRQN